MTHQHIYGIRWPKVEKLFNNTCDLLAKEQQSLLISLCEGDTELFNEVDSLLKKYKESRGFLEKPVITACLFLLALT